MTNAQNCKWVSGNLWDTERRRGRRRRISRLHCMLCKAVQSSALSSDVDFFSPRATLIQRILKICKVLINTWPSAYEADPWWKNTTTVLLTFSPFSSVVKVKVWALSVKCGISPSEKSGILIFLHDVNFFRPAKFLQPCLSWEEQQPHLDYWNEICNSKSWKQSWNKAGLSFACGNTVESWFIFLRDPVMNWPLVQSATLPPHCDAWRSLQQTPATLEQDERVQTTDGRTTRA